MRIFTAHAESVGETYLQHLSVALRFGGRLFAASLACCVHGFLPFLFQRTGSRTVQQLNAEMVLKRAVRQVPDSQRDVQPHR